MSALWNIADHMRAVARTPRSRVARMNKHIRRAAEYLVGAEMLGAGSLAFKRGWWQWTKLPRPYTFEGVAPLLSPLDEALADAGVALASLDCALADEGWEWRATSAWGIVGIERHDGTRRGLQNCDAADDLTMRFFFECEQLLARSLDTLTGCEKLVRRSDLIDGMGALPPHWYRAACAMLDAPIWWHGHVPDAEL